MTGSSATRPEEAGDVRVRDAGAARRPGGRRGAAPSRRATAINRLGAAAFQTERFAPFHAEFVERLRDLAVGDDKELRLLALDRLTLEDDEVGKGLLRESLEGSRAPLVPPATATRLLARDEHGDAVPLFRELAQSAPARVREEAVRALAFDPESADLLASISSDRSEPTEGPGTRRAQPQGRRPRALRAGRPRRGARRRRGRPASARRPCRRSPSRRKRLPRPGPMPSAMSSTASRSGLRRGRSSPRSTGSPKPAHRGRLRSDRMPSDVDTLIAELLSATVTAQQLRQDAPHVSGLSSTDAERVRAHLLASFETRGIPAEALPVVAEELRTSVSPAVLAGAARAVRSLGPDAGDRWRPSPRRCRRPHIDGGRLRSLAAGRRRSGLDADGARRAPGHPRPTCPPAPAPMVRQHPSRHPSSLTARHWHASRWRIRTAWS